MIDTSFANVSKLINVFNAYNHKTEPNGPDVEFALKMDRKNACHLV